MLLRLTIIFTLVNFFNVFTSAKTPLSGKKIAQTEAELNELGSTGVDKNILLQKGFDVKIHSGERNPSSVIQNKNNFKNSSGVNENLLNQQQQLGLRDGGILPSGLIEKIYVAQIQGESPSQSKKKMTDEAIAKTAESLIADLVGAEQIQKNKTAYQDKIIKNSGRFIPLIKTNEISKDQNGNYNLTITLNANLKVLESMLKENGLFYVNESMPQILPLMGYLDLSQGQSFKWWKENSKDPELRLYENQYLMMEKLFIQSFSEQGFKVQRPENYGLSIIPQDLAQKDQLTNEDLVRFSLLFKSPVIVEGEIRKILISQNSNSNSIRGNSYQLEINLNARQAVSGRVLAELVRKSNWENVIGDVWSHKKVQQWVNGIMKDLSSQVKEAWQRGTLATTTIKLVVKGGVSPMFSQKFKETILNQSKFVRQIRERLISFEETIYEIDISGSYVDVANPLQTISISGLGLFKLTSSSKDVLEFTRVQ